MQYFVEYTHQNPLAQQYKTISSLELAKRVSKTMIVLALVSTIFLTFIDTTLALFVFVFGAILWLPSLIIFLITTRQITKYTVTYDYILQGESFKIVKVSTQRRKIILQMLTQHIYAMGNVDSDEYKNLANNKSIQTINAYCLHPNPTQNIPKTQKHQKKETNLSFKNTTPNQVDNAFYNDSNPKTIAPFDEDTQQYPTQQVAPQFIFINNGQQKILLCFQPNQEFMITLKRSIPRLLSTSPI